MNIWDHHNFTFCIVKEESLAGLKDPWSGAISPATQKYVVNGWWPAPDLITAFHSIVAALKLTWQRQWPTTHDEDLVKPEESVPSPLNHIYALYIFCNTTTTRGLSSPDIYTAEMTSWLCSSCGVPVSSIQIYISFYDWLQWH